MNIIFLTKGTHLYAMPTDNQRLSSKLLETFITRYAVYRKYNASLISAVLKDEKSLSWFKYNLTFGTLEEVTTENGYTYYKIHGKNYSYAFPPEDYKKDVIMMDTVNTFQLYASQS